MRNGLDKSCRENQNRHFMLNNFSENRNVYEIVSKNVAISFITSKIWGGGGPEVSGLLRKFQNSIICRHV